MLDISDGIHREKETFAMSLPTQSIPDSQPFAKTSLVEMTNHLPSKPPCRVFFKNEYEQPCGSFKLRGIANVIYQEIIKARRLGTGKMLHVFASSGGNAGLAAAYLARYYGVGCTVVLPVTSKPEIIDKLQSYGAKTTVFGNNINEADKHLKNLMREIDNSIHPIYCHPFDNPLIWDGHASMMDEIYQEQLSYDDAQKVKGVVCSVGGGGLYNGIINGLNKNTNANTSVMLVETNQAPTLMETIKAGEIITLETVNSMATSLACSYLADQSLENYYHSKFKTYVDSMDDLDAIQGVVDFYNNSGVVVEPACGAALSLAYNRMDILNKHFSNLSSDDIVIFVACGGSCTNLEGVQNFKKLVNNSCKL